MEKLRNALIARLMILLEFEPGDAVQDGYFQYLDELRSGAVENETRTARERVTARRQIGIAG